MAPLVTYADYIMWACTIQVSVSWKDGARSKLIGTVKQVVLSMGSRPKPSLLHFSAGGKNQLSGRPAAVETEVLIEKSELL